MSSIWGEGLRGSRPVAAVSLQAEILGRASIEGQQKPGCPDPFRVGTSEALTLVSDRPGRSSDVSWRIPTLKGSGHPSWAVASGLLGSGSGRTTHKFRPPPTPVGGGWPKAGRGLLESSQRIRGPQARFKLVVSGLIWATAQPSTESPSRPVGAPSPKSEILGRASNESLWWAAPPRLSPTLPEASSERALKIPTLKGSGHPSSGGVSGSLKPDRREPAPMFRPPRTLVGAGLGGARSLPALGHSPRGKLGEGEVWKLAHQARRAESGHPGWALFEAQTRWEVWL
mgnify:CR=1 FL=1